MRGEFSVWVSVTKNKRLLNVDNEFFSWCIWEGTEAEMMDLHHSWMDTSEQIHVMQSETGQDREQAPSPGF